MMVASAIRIDWPDNAGAAGALGRERHQGQRDQSIEDGPDQNLVGDALGQIGRRRHKRAAERERRIVGQRRNERGQHERRGPAATAGYVLGRELGRQGAVGNFGQPQVRKHWGFEQAVEHADQEDDKADQRDQRADLLTEPDLVAGGAGCAALQGLGEPVEAVADRFVRNMLGRVGHRGRVEHPRGALRDVAIDLAGLDSALGAEQRPKLWALGDVARQIDAPHQGRRIPHIARTPVRHCAASLRFPRRQMACRWMNPPAPSTCSRWASRRRRRARSSRPSSGPQGRYCSCRRCRGCAGAPAHRGRQNRWRRRAVAIAVAGLVEVKHHIAAAGKFDGKAILGLARIDVAVNRENAGGGGLRGGVRRNVEQGAHHVALGTLEPAHPRSGCRRRFV